jgi:hypothetical protein
VVVRAGGLGKVLECMLDSTDAEYDAGTMRGGPSLLVALVDVVVVFVAVVVVRFMWRSASCGGRVARVMVSCGCGSRDCTSSRCGWVLGDTVDSCLTEVVVVEVDKVVDVELVGEREVEEGVLLLRVDGLLVDGEPLDEDELLEDDELLDDDELLEE